MGVRWTTAAGAVVLFALIGCGGGGDSAKPKYEWLQKANDRGGFTVHYPYWDDEIGWVAVNMEASTMVSKGPGSDIDCAAEVMNLEGETLEDHVATDLKARKKNKAFKILAGPSKIRGGKGKRVTYEMKSAPWKHVGDGMQKESVSYILKGKKVYSLRTSAPSSKWDIRIKYFKQMHKKFKIH